MTGAKLSLGSQEEQDNLLIQQALALDPSEFDRELEPGEKADDAIDFGDLSDGDLAEFEDDSIQNVKDRNLRKSDEIREESSPHTIDPIKYPVNAFSSSAPKVHDQNKEVQADDFEAEQHEGNAVDDLGYLFNGSQSSSGSAEAETRREEPQTFASAIATKPRGEVEFHKVDGHAQGKSKEPLHNVGESAQAFTKIEDIPMAEPGRLVEMQRELFAMSGYVVPGHLKPSPKNPEELLSSLWPTFQRGTIPKFMQILPPSSTPYIGAKRPKRIKPVKPTRIKLELADDQERSFKLPFAQTTSGPGSAGCTVIIDRLSFNRTSIEAEEREPDLEFESTASELDNEPIGRLSWQDMDFASADFNSFDERPPSPERMEIDDYDYHPLPRQDKVRLLMAAFLLL